MLNYFLFDFNLKKSIKSGLYIDYFFRKLSNSIIKNSFIWFSIFFLEKYIIEYFSKNHISFYSFLNKNLSFDSHFYISIYVIFLVELFLLIFINI